MAASPESPERDNFSLGHLLARLELLERRIRRSVEERRAGDPNPDDPLRGLYLTDEHVEWLLTHAPGGQRVAASPDEMDLLEKIERGADNALAEGHRIRLREVTTRFGLTPVDVELLLVCMAPDLDARVERLYGYLNDDVSRRRPTIGLALELCGSTSSDVQARARLSAGGPLIDWQLVCIEQDDVPFLSRTLRVPDRVTAFVLGDDRPDAALAGFLRTVAAVPVDAGPLVRVLEDEVGCCYLFEEAGSAAYELAEAALRTLGRPVIALDLDRLGDREGLTALVSAAARETQLTGAGLVAGPVDAWADKAPEALRQLSELPCSRVLVGRRTWDPSWSTTVPATYVCQPLGLADRAALWHDAAGSDDTAPLLNFKLSPDAIVRAVRSAELAAVLDDAQIVERHLLAGARSQNAAGLERHARRVNPEVDWDSLVVRPRVLSQLKELSARAANRDLVLDEWKMRPGGGRGRGVTALFAGDPGTGKTMAAEVVAGALGLDMYAVDLSTVVDKYIGETEKHLERIFSEAEGINGVILFDEADALFGKRSEVGDAKDRHANIEVAYLLQRMERFDGLAILSTNLSSNIDEAFARRLDAIIEFPTPNEDERRTLWELCLGSRVPRADDLDLEFCARQFEIAGGSIRSIATTASYLAADLGAAVSMEMLMLAVEREYRKLGRLVLESEFGPWYKLVRS